jgi:hypothetical protein
MLYAGPDPTYHGKLSGRGCRRLEAISLPIEAAAPGNLKIQMQIAEEV